MKKIITALCLILIAGTSYGQLTNQFTLRAYTGNFTAKSTPDTTSNTDTTYLSLADYTTSNPHVTYQVTLANISGTSTGTISAQGSDDGSIWYDVSGSSTETATQTFTVSLTSAATKTVNYKWPSGQYARYRVRYISGGTQTSVMTGKAWRRKTGINTSSF